MGNVLKFSMQVLAVDLSSGIAADECVLLQEHRRPWHGKSLGHDESLLQTSALSLTRSTASESSAVSTLDMAKRQAATERRHKYLDDMFETATELVGSKEQVTPVVVRFVADVLSTIDETVLPAIMDEHEQDQGMLVNLYAPIWALENGDMDGEQDIYQAASEQHIECRTTETEHCAAVSECEVREAAAAAVLAEKEEMVAEFQETISEDWCGQSADKMELSFRNRARPRLRRYLEAENEADTARAAHDEIIEECEAYRAAQQEQRQTCDELQHDLESATCVYAFAVNSARRTLIERYEAAVDAYEVASRGVRVSEADRKVEYTVLQRTKCLLGLISDASAEPCDEDGDVDIQEHVAEYAAEAGRQMQECHGMPVDTSILDIHYNDTNGLHPSVPGMPLYPCNNDFLEHEYGTLNAAGTCAGPSACSPCVGLVGEINEAMGNALPPPESAATQAEELPQSQPTVSPEVLPSAAPAQLMEFHIGVTNLWSQDWRGRDGVPPAALQEAGNAWCMASQRCMRQTACGTDGNVFTTEELDCTAESPCDISFRHSGSIWQGFSQGFPGTHTWAATSSQSQGRLVSTAVTARGQWSQTSYTYPGPTEAENMYLEQRRVMLAMTGQHESKEEAEHAARLARNPDVPPSVTGRVHLMFQTFDGDCDSTVVENIVFRKADGSRKLQYFF